MKTLINDSKNRKTTLEFLFLGLTILIVLSFFFNALKSITVKNSLQINQDDFRDYMFLMEIFNGRILLQGATSGIHKILHGVLGYWLLYPFVLFNDYILTRVFILAITVLILLFFLLWGSKRLSSAFSFFCVLYFAYTKQISFTNLNHLTLMGAIYCILFYFLISNNLFGILICTFLLFQCDILNWILFIPFAFMCLRKRRYKYFHIALFFVIYFPLYIFRLHYKHLLNLDLSAFIAFSANNIPYTFSLIIQIVLPLLGFLICLLYRSRNKETNEILFTYFFPFLVLYNLIALFLNTKMSYFVMPAAVLIGYTAHSIYQFKTSSIFLTVFITSIGIIFAFPKCLFSPPFFSVNSLYNAYFKMEVPVGQFVYNTFTDKEIGRNTCNPKIYEILLSLKFNNQAEIQKDKYFLVSKSRFDADFKKDGDYLKRVKEFENGYVLYSTNSSKFTQNSFNLLYMPVLFCLGPQPGEYEFYNFKTGKEKINLLESYFHFNDVKTERRKIVW